MAVDPDLYFELSTEELREVTRFAVVAAQGALALVPDLADPRPADAVDAAWQFARGAPRSQRLRVVAPAAHRAAKEATDPVAAHAAYAAGDAAASAFLHPFAKGDQVGHILRSTAHAALAAEASTGDPGAAQRVLEDGVRRATPVLLDVLVRYPPFPPGRSRVAELVCALDAQLRLPTPPP